MKSSKKFWELVERDEIAVAAGAHDPLTARITEKAGFADAIYMTGWGSSVARTGMPDAGLWTMTEMAGVMSNVTDVVSIPVFADADDGHGDALNVVRTVKKCIKSGLSAIHIEDEAPPKPLVPGRRVLPRRTAKGKIEAAADTRDKLDEDFTIIARSMAHYPQQFGDKEMNDPIGEAIERVEEYYDAGADMITLTMDSREKYERVSEEVGHLPLLVTGNFAQLEPDEFEDLDVDVVMYPSVSTWATMWAVYTYQQKLADSPGEVMGELEAEIESLPISVDEIVGYDETLELAEKYMPGQLEQVEDTGTF